MSENIQPAGLETDLGQESRANKYTWPEDLIVHKPETLVGQQLNFKTSSDEKEARSALVEIRAIKQVIQGGTYARWLAEVEAATVQNGSTSPLHSFVLKNFKTNKEQQLKPEHATKTPAEHSLAGYQLLKSHGLKTWSTYRISGDGQMILMTNGNLDGKFLVSGPNSKVSKAGSELTERPLVEIEGFRDLVDGMLKQIEMAERASIYIPFDTWLFIIDKTDADQSHTKIDYILGDVDNVSDWQGRATLKINLNSLRNSLVLFLEEFVDRSVREIYLAEFADMILSKFNVKKRRILGLILSSLDSIKNEH